MQCRDVFIKGGAALKHEHNTTRHPTVESTTPIADDEKINAKPSLLPLRRNHSDQNNIEASSTPSVNHPSSESCDSIAAENILVGLKKLHPELLSQRQKIRVPIARGPPVSPIRTVHWSEDKISGVSSKVDNSLSAPLLPTEKTPIIHEQSQNTELKRRVTFARSDSHKQQRLSDDRNGRMDRNNPAAASESVVPDLMEVYDALTQSSTPQFGGIPPSASSLPGTAQQHIGYYSGEQIATPQGLPPVSDIASRQSSYRSRSIKSTESSEESYSETSSSKRKVLTAVDKLLRGKKHKNKDTTKVSKKDSRWSKRFTWPDELHRDFVAAVFEVGLKHSSPSAIMEHMKQNPNVTSERVKSHLQKYRVNRQKSRHEFMNSYDRALNGFNNNPHDFDDDGDHSFSCGEVAALLTHSVQAETADDSPSLGSSKRGKARQPTTQKLSDQERPSSSQETEGVPILHLPLLSPEESQSYLGRSFGYLVGMFQTLCLELDMKRQSQQDSQSHFNLATNSKGQVQHHSTQHQPYPQSLEETAAKVASINVPDPSIYDVVNTVPHMLVTRSTSDGHNTQMHTLVGGGIYRVQSHGIQHDQHQMTGAVYNHQLVKMSDDHPNQERNFVAHNYHRPPPSSDHLSHPAHQAAAAVPAQHLNNATNPCLVQSPLENTGSLSNASGSGTGRTLQAQKESSIMKQEMKSQKAFQNKMRALKQVELDKYGTRLEGAETDETNQVLNDRSMSHSPLQDDEGLDHDFWNSGDVDDQLFNFLMEP